MRVFTRVNCIVNFFTQDKGHVKIILSDAQKSLAINEDRGVSTATLFRQAMTYDF